jgi:PAS domain-containing protein
MVPTLSFAGFLLARVAENEEAQVTEGARRTAQQMVVAVDRELTGMVATLQALSTSPSLPAGDLPAFHIQASQARRIAGTEIALSDTGGRQLLDTRSPFGVPLPGAVEREAQARAVETLQPAISGFTREAEDGRSTVTVNVPVMQGGGIAHVLTMSVPTDHWRDLLRQTANSELSGGLVDRRGLFITRLRNHEQFVGRPAGEDLLALEQDQGAVVRRNVEGEKRSSSPISGPASRGGSWEPGCPPSPSARPLRRSVVLLLGVGCVLLALSLGLAAAFGSRIARPIRALSVSASRLGRGERVQPLSTGLKEVNDVALGLSAASIGLRERSAALRLSEERYRLATEAFQGAVFDFDVASNHSERTPRHYEMLGEAQGVIPTTKEGWHERIHPEDRPLFERARNSMYEEGASQYDAEYRGAPPGRLLGVGLAPGPGLTG